MSCVTSTIDEAIEINQKLIGVNPWVYRDLKILLYCKENNLLK